MGEVSYNDCDCVPGHKCDCWEAAAAARTALLDELEAAVEGWRSVDHGLFSGAVVDGWLVHRGAVLREIKKQRRP